MRLPNHSIERIWNFLEQNQDKEFVFDLKYDEELNEASVIIDDSKLTVTKYCEPVGDEEYEYSYNMERNGASVWDKHKFVVPIMRKLNKLI